MAAYFSVTVANELIDQVLNDGTAYSPPSSFYVGLFTADTGLRTSAFATYAEPSGMNYSRVEIKGATGRDFTAASGGTSSNDSIIQFSSATGTWGTITHVAFLTAATSGNVIIYGTLVTPRLINNGDLFKFEIGDIDVSL